LENIFMTLHSHVIHTYTRKEENGDPAPDKIETRAYLFAYLAVAAFVILTPDGALAAKLNSQLLLREKG
jgi:hypothetical protein